MYQITVREEEIIVTRHPDYGRQVWAMSRMTVRHSGDACVICDKLVGRYAFRPLTNKANRMKHICLDHRKSTG